MDASSSSRSDESSRGGRGGYGNTRGRGNGYGRGGYDFSRGRGNGNDSGRGNDKGRGRGGYDSGRGSYDTRGRGGNDFVRGRGGYESRGRGDYESSSRGRGGYESSRGRGDYESRGRGHYESPSRGRGGYDTHGGDYSSRGSYESSHGRGNRGRGNGNDSIRGGSGRGGYDNTRGRSNRNDNNGHENQQNRNQECLSSQFKIIIGEKSYAFNYEVEIVQQYSDGATDRAISKKCDRELCRYIVQKLCNFDIDYVYDGQAQLWSNQLISEPFEFVCPADAFDKYMENKLKKDGTLFVKIKHVGEFKLSDFGQYMTGFNGNNERRTQRNICELILSQSALNRGEFTSNGIGSLFLTKEVPFCCTKSGLVTREGNSKGVHVIDIDGKPQLIMSLEYSNKLFYPSGLELLVLHDDLINDGWKMEELDKLFCGLKCSVSYNPSRIITFDKFTSENVGKLRVGDTTMEAFFKERWQLQLHRLDKKGVIAKNNDNSRYGNVETFPLETLIICPDQSVPADRLPVNLHAKSLEINRLKTADRYARIMKQHEKLGFNNTEDSICNAFGLSVSSEMISGPFSRLSKNIVAVKHNQHLTVKDDGSFCFERNQYLIPARIARLVLLSSKRNERKSMECIEHIRKEAVNKGVIIQQLQFLEFDTNSTNIADWIRALRDLKDAFVICIDDNSDSHSLLKIAGAINGVSTQHIHWETAKLVSTGGRGQTRENIVHQLNIKSGGLNHKVLFDSDITNLNLDNETVFAIGLDVCHPTGNNYRGETAVPSTVGVVSNFLSNPNSFAGTFFYQKPRQEYIDPYFLQMSIKEMLQKNPRREKINTIVILRDGVSEGQYSRVLDTEVAAVKKIANEMYGHPNTRIVCIIVTKNGNARHFDVTNKHPQSLPPRSVVTFGCRFNHNQFYLVPHRAFQGTAKAIMCTVILDDVGCEKVEIQKFILALTNLHQIVCAPISLPEPIYLSDSLAQRGYEVFAALKQYSPHKIPRDESGYIKFQELSQLLGFNYGNLL